MADEARLGARVRALRRRENLSQAAFAQKLDISASYLNLIENNHRPLTAPLLIKMAQAFKVEVSELAPRADDQLSNALMEVFGDPLFEGQTLMTPDVKEVAAQNPGVARAVLQLYRAYREVREDAQSLASRIADGTEHAPGGVNRMQPNEEVSEAIQRRGNHIAELEVAAERLWRDARLSDDDLYRGLVDHLWRTLRIEVKLMHGGPKDGVMRRFDERAGVLELSAWMPPRSRTFQLCAQVAILQERAALEGLAQDNLLTTEESRALMRVAMANYFAGAVMMPYAPFLQAARNDRYDIELMGHRFRASFEQVAHRLCTLQRPGASGVPFHMLRIDVAGNISKRFSASGIQFARYSGACPRWNVFAAFMTPGMIRIQLSRMPDGSSYFCLARTITRAWGGYQAQHAVQAIGLGCRMEHARELVYSDGVDLQDERAVIPVGVTCRLCERTGCEHRAHPSIRHRLRILENVRTLSFYDPAAED